MGRQQDAAAPVICSWDVQYLISAKHSGVSPFLFFKGLTGIWKKKQKTWHHSWIIDISIPKNKNMENQWDISIVEWQQNGGLCQKKPTWSQ